MNNQMPSMPGMPAIKSDIGEDSGAQASESELDLSVPSHEEAGLEIEKPQLFDPGKQSATQIDAPLVPKKGIEVVATRKAFYNQNRISEDDKLFIKSEEDFGEWFRCVEPFWEKKRVEFLNNKKKARK